MKKMMMAAIVAAFVLFAPSAFALPIGYCVGKADGNYYQEYRNVPGGDAIKCQGGKTLNACEGNDGKGFSKGGNIVGICKGGSLTSDPFHYGKRLCVPPECPSPTWLPEADGRAVPPSGGGSSGGGSSSGGSSSGGSSSGGSLEIVDIGDSKPPKKQDGQNDGGKNGKQEGEIGPVGGWEKEPEKKAPKGQLYKVTLGCYAGEDCDFEKYADDLNDACSGSLSSGKHITEGYSYRFFVRNGVCYYQPSANGRTFGEVPADAKLVSSDKVPEDKKPKDKKKDEKPKDDVKECLDNNPHICKGEDGKWKDTREDGKPKEQQKPEDKGVFKDKDGVYRSEDDGGEVYKDKDGQWKPKQGKDGVDGNDGQNGRDGRDGRDAQDYSGILGSINQNILDLNRTVTEGFGKVSDGLSGLGGGSGGGGGNGSGQAQKGEGEGEGELEKYCKKHPNTLTCAEFNGNMPEEGDFSGLIPKKEVPIGWKFEDFLQGSSAKCPAPMKFNTMLGVISLSWEGFCEFLRMVRGFVIMAASVTGIMIVLKGQ